MGAAADGKTQTMILRSTLLIVVLVLLALPSGGRADERDTCGLRYGDWCPSYRGDPWNRHKNAAACKADLKCYGIGYSGESAVACMPDERGFAFNCPTVGCTSNPPKR